MEKEKRIKERKIRRKDRERSKKKERKRNKKRKNERNILTQLFLFYGLGKNCSSRSNGINNGNKKE